ncbi:MAG TPA: RNA polymerase sigma factor, partial [Verrucomicrobiae bacterium]
MTSRSDAELLAEYARSGAEAPFAELVHRYVGLVHSAACRQVKDAQHAEDIAQAVFLLLAQKAGSLVGHPGLGGWLLNSTRYVAKAHIRSAMRRTKREQEVAMDPTTTSEATELWAQLHPHLDSALAELSATDRALVALRFFQNKSAREAAGELGLAEAAAHKRTARALDKLRLIFQRRGVTVSVTALIAIFSTQAIQAAPVGLATKLTASAIVAAKSTAATSSGWTLAKATWKLWLVSQ